MVRCDAEVKYVLHNILLYSLTLTYYKLSETRTNYHRKNNKTFTLGSQLSNQKRRLLSNHLLYLLVDKIKKYFFSFEHADASVPKSLGILFVGVVPV